MDIIHHILRFTPFWAIALMIIAGECAYVFWLKEHRKVALSFFSIFFISFVALLFFILCGGPAGTVRVFMDITQEVILFF